MIPTQGEQDAPLSPSELNTMDDAVQLELTGDTSHLLPWLGLLSEAQKRQLWAALPHHTKRQIHALKDAALCALS